MSRSRRLRLRFALFAVLSLLLAQWSVAAYACVLGVVAQAAASHADCDSAATEKPGALCHKHCIGDEGGSRAVVAALAAPAAGRALAGSGIGATLAATVAPPGLRTPAHPPPQVIIVLHRFLT